MLLILVIANASIFLHPFIYPNKANLTPLALSSFFLVLISPTLPVPSSVAETLTILLVAIVDWLFSLSGASIVDRSSGFKATYYGLFHENIQSKLQRPSLIDSIGPILEPLSVEFDKSDNHGLAHGPRTPLLSSTGSTRAIIISLELPSSAAHRVFPSK